MPVEPNATLLEASDDAVIWRFMDLHKFRDLMTSEELYFRRADLFSDSSEGLPPDQYALRVFGLDPYDIKDRASLNHHMGSLAQHRECYYISCWHLFRQEQLGMWEQYGHDGVAVCSRYGLLKAALDGLLDEASLALVRYGTDHLENTFNTIQFITTKQTVYAPECEVRAWLTVYDPLAGGNRHFDLDNFPHPRPLNLNPRHSWVPDCKRRRIDLRSLITDVVVSPWSEADAVEDIDIWVKARGFPASSTPSALRGNHTPTLEEFRRARRLTGGGTHEPATADEVPATGADLDRLYEVLSGLTPSRVRWLYRQRWETCRLNPGQLPLVSDLQYLQTTLKVLDDWRRQGIDVG